MSQAKLESSTIFRWKIRPFFKWFDFWIGIYFDREGRAIYICLIPMFGIKVWWWRDSLEQKAKYEGAQEVLAYINAGIQSGHTIEEAVSIANKVFKDL